jgi:hypothetical protein
MSGEPWSSNDSTCTEEDRMSETKEKVVAVAAHLGVVAAILACVCAPGAASADAWSDANCFGIGSGMTQWSRADAIGYAQPPVREGYSLNGGCYRLNDRDDTPTLPADGGGEGTDCSGFVFRVWALRSDGSTGYKRWDYDKDIHGPWYSWDFYSPLAAEPFKLIAKNASSTTPMDAFAWYRGEDRHIALLWQELGSGSDLMVHAHNNSVGVEISEEIYRQYPDIHAVSRKAWSTECHTRCS